MRILGRISTLVISACTTSDPDLLLDQAAAEDEVEGKADGVTGLVRLERATAAEVATSFKDTRSAELFVCFEGYRSTFDTSATHLTKAVADQFIQVSIQTDNQACAEWSDLGQIVKGVLDANQLTKATPLQINGKMYAWAEPQLEEAVVDGYVRIDKADLLFYSDISRVQDDNAMKREKHPAGIDLGAIRAQWRVVRSDSSLDRAYLNPVTFPPGVLEGDQVFKYLRAAFPLRTLSLQSTGYTAISGFAAANEGPESDPAFQPIATAFRKTSIKKRFYFATNDTSEWSSNVLIVVDSYGQAYGMQMGYSE